MGYIDRQGGEEEGLTCIDDESSTLAFSAASLTLCRAILSLDTSSPCCMCVREKEYGRTAKQCKMLWYN